jgi:hypothetical protein
MCNYMNTKKWLNDRYTFFGTVKRGWKFTIWNLDFSIKTLSPYTCN